MHTTMFWTLRLLTVAALVALPSLALGALAGCGGGGGGGGGGGAAEDSPVSILLQQSTLTGQVVEIPREGESVNYATMATGPLTGKKRIFMRYRVECDPGVKILPKGFPSLTSMITLHFQRAGDNLTGQGQFEAYRWYATFSSKRPIVPGVYEMEAPLDGNWTAVLTSSRQSNPAGFKAAVDNADRVGFVLGGGDGVGHGVYATGKARIVVIDFRVE